MEYRNNSSGEVETRHEILAKFPNTSFPSPLTNDVIESLGYTTVFQSAVPSVTPPYESYQRDGIEEIDSKWFTKYIVITADDAGKTSIDNQAAKDMRTERNRRLKETDYYALSDVTMSAEMTTYRQALRDLPTSSGSDWPHNVTWPAKP